MTSSVPPGGGNLIVDTLGRALGAMWDLFWPLFLPLGLFLLIAFGAYIVRKVMNVG